MMPAASAPTEHPDNVSGLWHCLEAINVIETLCCGFMPRDDMLSIEDDINLLG
jgi:hypothetical protein